MQYSAKVKIFCELLAMVSAVWWLFLIYLLYVWRDYVFTGTVIAIGTALVVAFLEMIRDEDNNYAEEGN